MKTRLVVVVFIIFIVLTVGCRRYKNYYTPTDADLTKYNNIHIGWVDLQEKYWRFHGYSSIDEWKHDIAYVNEYFQVNLERYWLEGKTVTFSEHKDDENYPSKGLLVTFDDVYIDQRNYDLYLSIKFIDLSTNETILFLEKDAYWGNGWGFTNYLTYALDNVSQKITWVILQKKKRNLLG